MTCLVNRTIPLRVCIQELTRSWCRDQTDGIEQASGGPPCSGHALDLSEGLGTLAQTMQSWKLPGFAGRESERRGRHLPVSRSLAPADGARVADVLTFQSIARG